MHQISLRVKLHGIGKGNHSSEECNDGSNTCLIKAVMTREILDKTGDKLRRDVETPTGNTWFGYEEGCWGVILTKIKYCQRVAKDVL